MRVSNVWRQRHSDHLTVDTIIMHNYTWWCCFIVFSVNLLEWMNGRVDQRINNDNNIETRCALFTWHTFIKACTQGEIDRLYLAVSIEEVYDAELARRSKMQTYMIGDSSRGERSVDLSIGLSD